MKSELRYGDNVLSYYDSGEQEKGTVIFVPAGIYKPSRDFIENLKDKQYRVICIDLPGQGTSKFSYEDNSIEGISKHLIQLLEESNVQRPHVVGVSSGANVLLETAREYDFQTITLVSSGEYFDFWKKLAVRIMFYPTLFFKSYRDLCASVYKALDIIDYSGHCDEQRLLISQRWHDVIDYKLPKESTPLEVPALLIQALHDRVVRRGSFERLAAQFLDPVIYQSNTGHLGQLDMLEQDELEQIVGFIEKHNHNQ